VPLPFCRGPRLDATGVALFLMLVLSCWEG
jgi:hypothetical protein